MNVAHSYPLRLASGAWGMQWPAIVLAVVVIAAAALRRVNAVPKELQAIVAWMSCAGTLITWPVYLWAITATLHSMRTLYLIAVTGVNVIGGDLPGRVCMAGVSQYVALLAVLVPGTAAEVWIQPRIGARAYSGALWALAAVSADYLFFLLMVIPIRGIS